MEIRKIYLAALIALFSHSAYAQFPGDVFFSEPSIAVSSGEKGTLDIEVFTGDQAFGATQFEISYDKNLIKIEGITAKNDDFENTISWIDKKVSIGIISVNGSSKLEPFGSVKLATINFEAIAQAGTRADISINVIDSINTNHQSYSSNTGYGAEINITDTATRQRSKKAEITLSTIPENTIKVHQGELYERARNLRPSGEIVVLKTLDSSGKLLTETTVQAIDFNSLSE